MAKKEKFTFASDLHLCCENNEMRPALSYVYFKDGFAYATNGIMLIKQSLKFNNFFKPDDKDEIITLLNGEKIHMDAFKSISRFDFVSVESDGFKCWNAKGDDAFFPFAELSDDVVIPDFETILSDILNKEKKPVEKFGVNPRFFGLWGKILADCHQVKISFTDIASPMIIQKTPAEFDDFYQIGIHHAVLIS